MRIRRTACSRAALVATVGLALHGIVLATLAARIAGGDARVFFQIGDRQRLPPYVRDLSLPVLRDSFGYDGQFYLVVATDPLFSRRQTASFIDAPAYRYGRIGLPGAAAVMCGGGRPACVSFAIPLICMLAVWAGGLFAARLAMRRGVSEWAGLAWVLLPSITIGLPRLLPDVLASALCLAALDAYERDRARELAAWLLLAALTRETTLLLAAAVGSSLLSRGARGRAALVTALPLGVWVAWHVAVAGRAPAGQAWEQLGLPLRGFCTATLHALADGRLGEGSVSVLSFGCLAVSGCVCAHRLAIDRTDAISLFGIATTLLGLCASALVWESVTGSARTLDGVQVAALLAAARTRRWRLAVAPALIAAVCIVRYLSIHPHVG